jgi:hypothetical protein
VKPHPCPICKKTVETGAPAWPFCSPRCRTIDLGNWLGGRYAIAGEHVSDENMKTEIEKKKP